MNNSTRSLAWRTNRSVKQPRRETLFQSTNQNKKTKKTETSTNIIYF
jgi:hypothetical protein